MFVVVILLLVAALAVCACFELRTVRRENQPTALAVEEYRKRWCR